MGTPEKVLRVPPGTKDTSVLSKAFRKRSRETHPDLGGSAEEFTLVQEAYDVLMGKLPIHKSSFAGLGVSEVTLVKPNFNIQHINLFEFKVV